MKKPIVLVAVFVFSLALFNINANSTHARTNDCSSVSVFSPSTGKYCPDVCASGDNYNWRTGVRCSVKEPGSSEINFQYVQNGLSQYYFSISSGALFDKVTITPDCNEGNKVEVITRFGEDRCRSFSASLRPTNGIGYTVDLNSKDSSEHNVKIRANIYYKNSLIGEKSINVKVGPREVNNKLEPFVSYKINGVESNGRDQVVKVKQGEPVNISWESNGEYCEGYTYDLSSSWNGKKKSFGSETVKDLSVGEHVMIIYCYNKEYKKGYYAKDDTLKVVITSESGSYFTTPISITTPAPLPVAKTGRPYTQSIYANGPASSWSYFGELPPGLTFKYEKCNGGGFCELPATISGVPIKAGTYYFTARVYSGIQSATKRYTLVVEPATPRPTTPIENGGRNTVLGEQTFSFSQKLELGSTGNEVVELQKYLAGLGLYGGAYDGRFGLNTYKSLVQYQKANGLEADGVVGAKVRELLNK